MLLAPIYNYIKLIAFSLSYKEKESKGFDITQCDFEVHTKESIWKK